MGFVGFEHPKYNRGCPLYWLCNVSCIRTQGSVVVESSTSNQTTGNKDLLPSSECTLGGGFMLSDVTSVSSGHVFLDFQCCQ